jgi:acid phosphatase type 7
MRSTLLLLLAALAACLALAGPAAAQTVWAVGDGADSSSDDDTLAAHIQGAGVDKLLYLGDVYENGTAAEYSQYYDPGFGRMKAITAPTPGNHEWDNRAQGYDPYWGTAVQQPGGGHYYSFDFGGFHFVSLNSEEPTGYGSPQVTWLQRDLARYPGTCTIPFIHRPRWSAGPQWNTVALQPIWSTLRNHAVVLLSGHAHNYQRHKPYQGITQFVIGTGGHEVSGNDPFDPRLARGVGGVIGALRMRLQLGGFGYDFIDVDGRTLDRGLIECKPHTPAPARLTVSRPRNGTVYRSVRTLSGTSQNARRLSLSLIRRAGKACSAWNGKRLTRSSCGSRKSVPFASAPRWKVRLPGTLPKGSYRLTITARAIDDTLARRVSRFRIGKRR